MLRKALAWSGTFYEFFYKNSCECNVATVHSLSSCIKRFGQAMVNQWSRFSQVFGQGLAK